MNHFVVLLFVLIAACKSSDNATSTAKSVESAPTPAVAAPAPTPTPAPAAADKLGPFDRAATSYDLAALFPGATITLEPKNDEVEGGAGDDGLFHGDTAVVEKDGEQLAWVELIGTTNVVQSIKLFGPKSSEPQTWTPDEAKRPSLIARPALAKK